MVALQRSPVKRTQTMPPASPPRLFVVASFVVACSAHVERLPATGETLAARRLVVEPGGKGFNLAVAARRLGAAVDGVMAVGDDPFAALAGPALARAGLPGDMVRFCPGPTGGGVGFTDAAGLNCLAVALGANAALSADHVAERAGRLRASAVVLATFEVGDAPIRAAFRLAREAGRDTLLNPSPHRAVAPDLLADTTILVANASEAGALGAELGLAPGAPAGALAGALLARGPRLVVLTRGEAGASAFTADGAVLHQEAFPVAAVDTLGCGDAFAAALAVALAQGRDLAAALRRACAAGALVAGRPGVLAALPGWAEVEGLAGPA